jgi:hypothetical protein
MSVVYTEVARAELGDVSRKHASIAHAPLSNFAQPAGSGWH